MSPQLNGSLRCIDSGWTRSRIEEVKTWLIILSIAVIVIGLVVYLTTRPPSRSSDYEIDDVIAMPHSGTEERERTAVVDMYCKDAGPVDIEVKFISNGEEVAAGEITWDCPEPGDWEVTVPIELTPGFTWYVTYNEIRVYINGEFVYAE